MDKGLCERRGRVLGGRTRVMAFAVAVLVAVSAWAAMDVDSYDTSVTPGVWCGNFESAKGYAEANDMPLVLLWSKTGCSHCETLTAALKTNAARDWAARQRAVFCYAEGDGYGNDLGANMGKDSMYFAAYAGYTSQSSVGETPIVCLYWHNRKAVAFTGQEGKMYSKDGTGLLAQFENSFEKFVSEVDIAVSFAMFTFGDTENDRLEAIAGVTAYVDVPLFRTNGVETVVANVVSMTFADGSSTNVTVSWNSGETNHFVRCSIPGSAQAGDKIALSLRESGGTEIAVRHIWVITEPENSPKNPYWLGEKAPDALNWGEWTMDIAAATGKVNGWNAANPSQKGYAMVLVEGCCWCPDCAMAEANIFGNPGFKAWAQSRRVVFGVMDIPNNPQPVDATPSLLRYETYRTSDSFVTLRKTAATNETMRYQSGAGYLSRHSIDYADALALADRNRFLMGHDTLSGGWNRPERTNKNRTGVPVFLLLRGDGTIAARWNRFSDVGPGAFHPGYLRRFDEMLAMADEPFEEANDDKSTTQESISPATTSVVATVSAVDRADVYALDGFADGTVATFSITGTEGAPLSVSVIDGETGAATVSVTGTVHSAPLALSTKIGAARQFLKIAPVADSSDADAGFFGYASDADSVCHYSIATTSVMSGGDIGFVEKMIYAEADSIPGSTQRIAIVVSRTAGERGAVRVGVRLANPPVDGRIAWTDTTFTWNDGERGSRTNYLYVANDGTATGDLDISFVLADLDAEAEDAVIADGRGAVSVHLSDADVFGTLLYRNVDYAESMAIDGWQEGCAVLVRKVAGSMPSGLTLRVANGCVVVSGTPTRNGEYSARYSVSVMRGGMTVASMEMTFDFTVGTLNAASLIPSLASTRTYSNLPIVDEANILRGLITLTVPASGRLSAKVRDTTGTMSFRSSSWDEFDVSNRCIRATLKSAGRSSRTLSVVLTGDGGLATLREDGDVLAEVILPSEIWSPAANAKAWEGQYTVQMPQTNIEDGVSSERLSGSGYMAMRMIDSAVNRGAMLYAGVLPNGRAIYGTATLVDCKGFAEMPFFHRDPSDGVGYEFSGSFGILPNAAAEYRNERWSVRACADPRWSTADGYGHAAEFLVYGGYYDKDGISARFTEDFLGEQGVLAFQAMTSGMTSGRYGDGAYFTPVRVNIAENAPSLDAEVANPQEVELLFSPETGVVSGSLYVPFEGGRRLAALYRAIALPGWQGCSSCSLDDYVECPWADGSCSFADRVGGVFLRNGFRIKIDEGE